MILAIVQARMSSTRLPGKVLKEVLGKHLILHMLERVKRARKVDKLILATSTDPADDILEKKVKSAGFAVFRGNLNDVLDRFYKCALQEKADVIVRLTGDCPLHDPDVIDEVIENFFQGNADYVSNTLNPTFPDGLDTEVFSFTALKKAWQEAKLPSEREHVTPYIWKNSDYKGGSIFKARNAIFKKKLSPLRWVVDDPEDLEFVRHIYEALYPINQRFGFPDILDFLEKNPGVRLINEKIERNEGLKKSLEEDKAFQEKQ